MNKFTKYRKNNKKDKNTKFYVLTMIFNSDIIILLKSYFRNKNFSFSHPIFPLELKFNYSLK